MRKSELIIPFILFGILLVAVSPSSGWLDTSELSLASHVLGVGHPPGQPVYSILGKISQLVPIGNLSFRTNLLSAIFIVISFMFFLKIVSSLFRECDLSSFYKIITSLVCIYFFLAYSFMIQGVRTELYSLNLFIYLALFYFLINRKYPLAGFFLWGLSLGCHPLLGVSVLPGVVLITWNAKNRFSFYLKGVLFAIIGISVYLYLPLRAHANPVFNFGDPSNLKSFVWVISGALYKAYGSVESGSIYENAVNILYIFFDGINPLFFVFGFIGLTHFAVRRSGLGFPFFIIFLANTTLLLVNMHFDIYNPDAHGYLLISFITIGIGFVYLLISLLKRLHEGIRTKYRNPLVIGSILLLSLLSIYQVYRFFPDYDKRGDWSAQRFGKNIVEDLPYESVVFTGSFATHSVLGYLVFAENFRSDVKLLFTGFIENEGYLRNVESHFPDLPIVSQGPKISFDKSTFESISGKGYPVLVELSIKERKGVYGIRYGDNVLKPLCVYGWFFRFAPLCEQNWLLSYRKSWDEKIFEAYPKSDYEFKKHVLLGVFLHAKFFLDRRDFERARYLIDSGLKFNKTFEPFIEMKKIIGRNK